MKISIFTIFSLMLCLFSFNVEAKKRNIPTNKKVTQESHFMKYIAPIEIGTSIVIKAFQKKDKKE